jgi:hypothetical protein
MDRTVITVQRSQFGTTENRQLIVEMLRGHARREHHCQVGETTQALLGDYRWMAADWIERLSQDHLEWG